MAKLDSLILLVKSLSKSEKKALTLHSAQTGDQKIYLDLFSIIDREKYASENSISEIFQKKHPESSLTANVKYLFDLILQVVVDLNIRKSKEYELHHSYLKTKILRERGLYDDFLDLIRKTKEDAIDIGDYNLLLTLQRDELKSDLFDHFNHVDEKELFKKQQYINDNLKIIRQINEVSFLYEMLRFKIEKQKSTDTNNTYAYNDLLISEMSLVSSLQNDIFEINRLHQLFQANYFISIGSYKSALNSYSELNQLYLKNEKLWNNPPVYYVTILEGILESLNQMKLFDEMKPYLKQLTILTQKYPYSDFVLDVNAIHFLYSVAPHIRKQEYKECLSLIEEFRETLINQFLLLSPQRFLDISICLSGIYLMNKNLSQAKKQLAPIIKNNIFASLKTFRSAELLNLVIYYELGDLDYLEASIRSIKRKNKKTKKETRIEKLLFNYFFTEWKIMSKQEAEMLKMEFRSKIENRKHSIEELQLIKVFNFDEWILTKLK